MEKRSKIMIALDDSSHSTFAFEWYMDHMNKPDHDVIIVNIPHYAHVTTPVVSTSHTMMVQEGDEEVSRIIEHIKDRLDQAGVPLAKLLRLTGEAGPSIVKAANENRADCIITGSRGFGPVKRTLIGSVSDYILHHAHCPVLVCQQRRERTTSTK